MEHFKLGHQFYYTGDRANMPGIATIKEIRQNIYSGKTYVLEIKCELQNTRIFKGVSESDLIPGPGQRFIDLKQYRAERKKQLAQMEAYMKNKPVNFHSQCVQNQSLSTTQFI